MAARRPLESRWLLDDPSSLAALANEARAAQMAYGRTNDTSDDDDGDDDDDDDDDRGPQARSRRRLCCCCCCCLAAIIVIVALVSAAALSARPYDGVLSANYFFVVDRASDAANAWATIKSESARVKDWASSVALTRLPSRLWSSKAADDAAIVDATAYEVVEHEAAATPAG